MYNIYLIVILPFVILGYVVFFWRWKKNEQNFYPKDRPLWFGHRGSPNKITENTIPSFKKAIDQGVDGLEFDVRLSKDKHLVIFHDKNLLRMAGDKRKIKELTTEEMRQIKLSQVEGQEEEAKIRDKKEKQRHKE